MKDLIILLLAIVITGASHNQGARYGAKDQPSLRRGTEPEYRH